MPLAQSNKKGVVLFLSNGHAEDLIASTVIEKLSQECFPWEIRALPLVGEGRAYDEIGIKVLGPRRMMPSGGFVEFNPLWLARDMAYRWLGVLLGQVGVLRKQRVATRLVVCVGDIFLVILSVFFLKKPIVFLSTAKSDYARLYKGHYLVEKWLMKWFCQLVLPRDELTTSSLQDFGINAVCVGNVMMDCLKISDEELGIGENRHVVGILPGSKEEAYKNLPIILDAVKKISGKSSLFRKTDFLLALAASLSLKRLGEVVSSSRDWILKSSTSEERKRGIAAYLVSSPGIRIKIVRGRFADVLNSSQVIIGLSGMGNEQAVGLGKPVVSFPTKGPQITKKFLRIQQLILGEAISIVEPKAEAVAEEVSAILSHPEKKEEALTVGKERMGGPGAAVQVADLIKKELGE